MKILLVTHADVHGGASIAALRLLRALQSQGVDVQLLVGKKLSDEHGISGGESSLAHRWSDLRSWMALTLSVIHSRKDQGLRSYNILPSGLAKRINDMDVDIVHLHWPHRELLSIAEIGRIRQPVVWTLHDMWAFCGAEHYEPLEDSRYEAGYPARDGFRVGFDLDRWTWRRKARQWANRSFTFVGPSRWMTESVKRSALMGSQPATTIPNCLDTGIFAPRQRDLARSELDLDSKRIYLLTVAMSIGSDRRKGLHLLIPALKKVSREVEDLELLIVGADEPKDPPEYGVPARYLGSIRDEPLMAQVYAAADLFLAPSLQDNLPNTVLESLACGTPVAAFDVGGMRDLIEPGVNGVLARAADSDDLAEQIAWMLREAPLEKMCEAARQRIEARNSPEVIAQRHLEVYAEALE